MATLPKMATDPKPDPGTQPKSEANGQPPATVAGGPPTPAPAAPKGRSTTRGMLPELVAVYDIHKKLMALEPAERAWAIDFLHMKFPKP